VRFPAAKTSQRAPTGLHTRARGKGSPGRGAGRLGLIQNNSGLPKDLELLHEIVPRATIIALLVNPTNPNAETIARELRTAARSRGLHLDILHASTEHEFDTVFATLVKLRAGALVIGTDAFFNSRRQSGSKSCTLLR
jgi:ABC-type uncharacterized transport system substrate-binding protein